MTNTTDRQIAQQHAHFVLREYKDMLEGIGDGGIFAGAIERVVGDALNGNDFTCLGNLARNAHLFCLQWLDEWSQPHSEMADLYAGITSVLDDQDSGLSMNGLRLNAAHALILFNTDRLKQLHDQLTAPCSLIP